MMTSRTLTPLLLALILGAAPLMAQTDDAESSTSGSGDSATDQDTTTPQAQRNSEPAPTSANTSSPFDYRSSEKISEDVPVSFPVDI